MKLMKGMQWLDTKLSIRLLLTIIYLPNLLSKLRLTRLDPARIQRQPANPLGDTSCLRSCFSFASLGSRRHRRLDNEASYADLSTNGDSSIRTNDGEEVHPTQPPALDGIHFSPLVLDPRMLQYLRESATRVQVRLGERSQLSDHLLGVLAGDLNTLCNAAMGIPSYGGPPENSGTKYVNHRQYRDLHKVGLEDPSFDRQKWDDLLKDLLNEYRRSSRVPAQY